jgi:hypothetical protein
LVAQTALAFDAMGVEHAFDAAVKSVTEGFFGVRAV